MVEKGGVHTFRISVEVGGSEVAAVSSVSWWMVSSLRKSEMVCDSESSLTSGVRDLGFRACFLTFILGFLTTSDGPDLPLRFLPLFGLLASFIFVRKSSDI